MEDVEQQLGLPKKHSRMFQAFSSLASFGQCSLPKAPLFAFPPAHVLESTSEPFGGPCRGYCGAWFASRGSGQGEL